MTAVVKCSLVSGVMSLMGAWSQAPDPVPQVEWWTPIALAFKVLVWVVVWCLRMSDVSCFCWCFRTVVSGVISVMSSQSVGSMLLTAVWSCVLVLGNSSSSSPMLVWPVWVRMAGATCCQLATRAVSLIWIADVKPNPPLLMEVKSCALSYGVSLVSSHSSCSLTVKLSRLVAVVVSRPMARAVKVASPAVAVRHNAWATCVVRPWDRRCCSRVAVWVRLVMSR